MSFFLWTTWEFTFCGACSPLLMALIQTLDKVSQYETLEDCKPEHSGNDIVLSPYLHRNGMFRQQKLY
eukprot:2810044-Amphidinium_carterae.2